MASAYGIFGEVKGRNAGFSTSLRYGRNDEVVGTCEIGFAFGRNDEFVRVRKRAVRAFPHQRTQLAGVRIRANIPLMTMKL